MNAIRLHGSVLPADEGSDESGLLVLLPSLGTTTHLWEGVVDRLRRRTPSLRILRADLPGHGSSPAAAGPFEIADLAEGVLRLVDEIGGGRFWIAGVSLGGTVALELAASHGERIRGLAMFSSGSAIQQPSTWIERAAQVRASGTASLVVGSASRWFAPGYLSAHPDGPGAGTLNELTEVDDLSYASSAEALGRFDRTESVRAITTPALIVSAEHDEVTSPESMSRLADALPTARYAELADASHLSVLERPEEAAQLLADFLGQAETAAERGMRTRRAVLGDVHVDAATAAIIPETAAFQDFITRYAWGEIWTRPELSRRERSIATLAVLVADGHEHELRMHLRAAMRNGLSSTEIAEVIMHTALYAGLPPANRGLAILREVLAVIDDETGTGDGERTRG